MLFRSIRPQLKKTPAKKRFNCDALKSNHCVEQLRAQLATNLSTIPDTPSDPNINTTWSSLRTAIYQAAETSMGFTRRKHQDWFDNTSPDIHNLLHSKYKAHAALLANPQSPTAKTHYISIRAEVQRTLRVMENDWWTRKASEIQPLAHKNQDRKSTRLNSSH